MPQLKTFSRRDFLASTGMAAIGACLIPRYLLAQDGPSPVTTIIKEAGTAKISITQLRGNISMLEGSGGNIAVFHGPEGKLMVDAGINVSRPRVEKALREVSSQPLKYLVNTHWHFDHASGNEWLHEIGATIIAQERTPGYLARAVRVADWNYTFPAAPKTALPTVLFADRKTLHFNGSPIELTHYGPAHTDCDISVHFPHADVIHVADTFWNGHYPFIDYSTGGSIKGMIRAAEKNLKTTTDKTIVIPGHGPLGNRAQLVEFRDMLAEIHHRVARLKTQGHSEKEVIAAKVTKDYDAKWGTFVIGQDLFTHLVYIGA